MGSMAQQPRRSQLRILFFKEEGWWVAQCLEYDFAAQAVSLADAQYELMRLMVAHVFLCTSFGEVPFEGIPRAPDHLEKCFEDGERLCLTHVPEFRPGDVPEAHVIDSIGTFDARVC